MNKNQVIREKCVDYSSEGFGVVKHQGFTLFVKGLMIGEEADIQILNLKKSFGYGRISEIITVSENRTRPKCELANKCGGCQIQHLKYPEQLEFKKKIVNNALKSIGKVEFTCNEIIGTDEPYRYRNKVQIPTAVKDNKLVGGFYRLNSNDIVPLTDCLLQSADANELYHHIMKSIIKTNNQRFLRHILIRESSVEKQMMVVLIVNDLKINNKDKLIELITEKFDNVVSIVINLNERNDNVILGDKTKIMYGASCIIDNILGNDYRISPKAFFQINQKQTEKLYSKAMELSSINSDDTVLDLYCGIGSISITLANKVKKVVGVEVVKTAIMDAEYNAMLNDASNCKFIVGDAGKISSVLEDNFDVVFVDPPRKGLDDLTKQSIMKMNPREIVYISCNPSTMARDINDLREHYQLEKVVAVDMFPQTHHVETICVLSKTQ